MTYASGRSVKNQRFYVQTWMWSAPKSSKTSLYLHNLLNLSLIRFAGKSSRWSHLTCHFNNSNERIKPAIDANRGNEKMLCRACDSHWVRVRGAFFFSDLEFSTAYQKFKKIPEEKWLVSTTWYRTHDRYLHNIKNGYVSANYVYVVSEQYCCSLEWLIGYTNKF